MRNFRSQPRKRNKKKDSRKAKFEPQVSDMATAPKEIKKIEIPKVISVKDLAEISGLPVTQIITELMKNGVLATINETIDYETAAIIGDDLGLEISLLEQKTSGRIEKAAEEEKSKDFIPRPPVVTIMGHVDHGKTTLLDTIRSAHVADKESGGITQHISAYQVTLENLKNKSIKHRTITFIDTPGHAAFSAMRGHGASITDIVVLIVAANDGVKPQTEEVIKQAKENNVPVIVAINKVDLPDADVMRVKQQLAEHDLLTEEWGGKTICVEISAKTGQNVEGLLEMILLQADIMNLTANPKSGAIGIVIESHIQKGAGAMALALIENGTLRKGDAVSIGSSFGRIRIMQDSSARQIEEAGPSFPVNIAGLRSLPNFGDRLVAFKDEKEAKDSAEKNRLLAGRVSIASAKKIVKNEEDKARQEIIDYNLIIKSDVDGSLGAIKKLIDEIVCEEANINIISEGVGAISESDVTLAKATNARIYGFRVKVLGAAKKIAEKEKVELKTYDVIYELIDKLKEDISAVLPPLVIEEEIGKGKILAIFRDDKKGFVTGGKVESGKITTGNEIKFLQDKNEKYRAKVSSLRREKTEVKECQAGYECGFGLPAGANVAVGDEFITFKTVFETRKIK